FLQRLLALGGSKARPAEVLLHHRAAHKAEDQRRRVAVELEADVAMSCRTSARSRAGVTASRVTAPARPRASSIAAALAARTAVRPPSPAPLMPSGFPGAAASSVIRIATASGTSRAVSIR